MRTLIINTTDIQGGAAIAANRLHKGLIKNGIDSKMLVLSKSGDDTNVIPLYGNDFVRKVTGKVNYYKRNLDFHKYDNSLKNHFFSNLYSINHIKKVIRKINPDIIHLHWVNGNFFNLKDLQKINRPIIWTLHDMWPFTGGCHYDANCGKYKNECKKCPLISSKKEKDITNVIFSAKKQNYKKIKDLTIIGLSRWLSDCAKESYLFKNRNVINLPNCINVNLYRPFNKAEIRRKYNISGSTKILLFGGIRGTDDQRKGYKYLIDALSYLERNDYELAIFGTEPGNSKFNEFKIHNFGYINNTEMSQIYSMADVTILPSLQENLSNIVIESLSCGTPVVAFDIGGNKDMIKHQFNGYLAEYRNSSDLAKGINWIMNTDIDIGNNAREIVLNNFSEEVIIGKYIQLYKNILHRN